jgi:hypothetical protein
MFLARTQGATGWAAAKASDFAADFQFEIVKKSRGKSENHRKIRNMSPRARLSFFH